VTWEYRTAEAEDRRLFVTECNALGVDGWELVHVGDMHGFLIGFFKRIVAK
jgi:hypothetical protein